MKKRCSFILIKSNGVVMVLGQKTIAQARKYAKREAKKDPGIILSQIGIGTVQFKRKIRKNAFRCFECTMLD